MSYAFWKCPWDVPNDVITHAQEKKNKERLLQKSLLSTFKILKKFNGG